MMFMGRKDTQVKIRGQRVELGEVEYHLRVCVPRVRQAVAEVILPEGEGVSMMLAAFIVLEGEGEEENVEKEGEAEGGEREEKGEEERYNRVDASWPPRIRVISIPTAVEEALAESLPGYMVPAVFFAVSRLPTTTGQQRDKRAPSTPAEHVLQEIWAKVLNLDAASIGVDDSFFRLGGDSVAAMKVVAIARRANLSFSVADVFRNPRLGALSLLSPRQRELLPDVIAPSTLIDNSLDVPEFRRRIAAACGLDHDSIADAYLCTPLQEGLLALTSKSAGTYTLRSVLELSENIDLGRLRGAWEEAVRQLPILRSRIVQDEHCGLVQAVIEEGIHWKSDTDLDRYLQQDAAEPMALGRPLARYAIVVSQDQQRAWFIWTLHHALYDGQFFARAATAYWRSEFEGYESEPFPLLAAPQAGPVADSVVKYRCALPSITEPDITVASLIRAAWALTASAAVTPGGTSDPADIVFGMTVSGRSATMAEIEEVAGPTIATVPVRIQINAAQSVSAFLQRVQSQSVDMIPYEQTGLQNIRGMSDGPTGHVNSKLCWSSNPGKSMRRRRKRQLACWEGGSLVLKQRQRFGSVMQQLATAKEGMTIAEVDMLTASDHEKLWAWNGTVPAAVDRCVHSLVEEQVQVRPGATAVCAWDGELTHAELDRLAGRLASHLADLGVTAETMVPLCFEKSKWAVVAMLAVLKAGGAFVPLDPSQATDRRELIITQTAARVVLTSERNAAALTRPDRHVVAVSRDTMASMAEEKTGSPVSEVVPTSAPYVIFTSGSTGQPKGVVVDHRAVSSSCWHHGLEIGFDQDSRVLQVVSYTFDVSIMEVLTTLLYGGCICINVAVDGNDDVEKAINMMNVNTTFLTPTMARLLDPSRLTCLKTLIMGGEAVTSEDLIRWGHLATVVNGYGPTECVVISSLNKFNINPKQGSCIGWAVGSVCWIVTVGEDDKLASIGVIGELLVEGPILARGYLHDTEKTAAAFIEDPPWLLRGGPGHPGRRGRLYKTGDLVRYNEDGSLMFMGRKDTQVKIRGQRVELGEVEHHLRLCVPGARQAVAEVILPRGEGASTMLAAFIVLEGEEKREEERDTEAEASWPPRVRVISIPTAVEEALTESLPGYMVPAVFFAVSRLPTTTSGKTDRRRLRELGSTFSTRQLAELRSGEQRDKRSPSTPAEHVLQEIWAQVLNLDAASIGVDDSFFRLAGDSITAMQVSSAARASLGNISTSDIFRKKTISCLVVDLSSVNQLALGSAASKDPNPDQTSFDQCFFLKLRVPVVFSSVADSIAALVSRHPMLRARFSRTNHGRWEQHLVSDIPSSFRIRAVEGKAVTSVNQARAIRQCREMLDIKRGPLLAALFFDQPGSQSLFITIHHLVVDLVSWRVLLQDLESLLRSGQFSMPPSMGFHAWCNLQAEYAVNTLDPRDSAPFEVQPPQLPYWGINASANVYGATAVKTFALDRPTTAAILGSCNEAFRTRPVELMISALAYSFSAAFPDRPSPPVFSEGHGREAWDNKIDISRTVGWFT
ncbi:hypothetical protein BKA61DRAFT_582816 [Leptodontidium sp. MPI-SDFR-AT-0119]|nr:hypothetical protein BKA61DRAFT_582816 [Leptodontidium sp. MPI-SDFR-AT-0119]